MLHFVSEHPALPRPLLSCDSLAGQSLFNRRCVRVLAIFLFLLISAGMASADSGTYTITGGFTTFSGNVGGDSGPTYIRAFPNSQVGCDGPGCSDPLAFYSQVCPAAGCSAASGIATNVSLLWEGTTPASFLTFRSFGCSPSIPVCANTPNELDFVPAPLTILGFQGSEPALLGSFTFSNGVWTGDADFGLTITATDINAPHNSYTFNGFIHMGLTPNDFVNNTPAQNADYVYLTDANHQPVTSSLLPSGLGSIRAYELKDSPTGSNTVTFNLYGGLGSLDPMYFGDVAGGGFADSSITNTLGGPPANTVPEASSLASLSGGLLLACAFAKFCRTR